MRPRVGADPRPQGRDPQAAGRCPLEPSSPYPPPDLRVVGRDVPRERVSRAAMDRSVSPSSAVIAHLVLTIRQP